MRFRVFDTCAGCPAKIRTGDLWKCERGHFGTGAPDDPPLQEYELLRHHREDCPDNARVHGGWKLLARKQVSDGSEGTEKS